MVCKEISLKLNYMQKDFKDVDLVAEQDPTELSENAFRELKEGEERWGSFWLSFLVRQQPILG